ncbi:MAG: hypothetical protein K0S08_672 [Gammaproteobacteria bacterium]|jgi:hypothetical protein|nr:hypothetical protein [Gammaproteobacteria bacterium]
MLRRLASGLAQILHSSSITQEATLFKRNNVVSFSLKVRGYSDAPERKKVDLEQAPVFYAEGVTHDDLHQHPPIGCNKPFHFNMAWKMAAILIESNRIIFRLTVRAFDITKNYQGTHISCYEENLSDKQGINQAVQIRPFNAGVRGNRNSIFYYRKFQLETPNSNVLEIFGSHSEEVKVCTENSTTHCFAKTINLFRGRSQTLRRQTDFSLTKMFPCKPFPSEPSEADTPCLRS